MGKYVVVMNFRECSFINNTKTVLRNCAKTKQFWDGLSISRNVKTKNNFE